MNTLKAFGISILLSMSLAGTAAAADSQAKLPDLSSALQQQIEARMSAELAARNRADQVVVHAGQVRPAARPAS